MKNIEPIKNWFGYSRRERRSAFILLIILVVVILVRYAVPQTDIAAVDVTSDYVADNNEISNGIVSASYTPLFPFDPNTASFDTLIRLGLSQKEASTLIRYREKGGKFRHRSDLKKVYGLDSARAEKLMPFVKNTADTVRKRVIRGTVRKKTVIDLNNCDSAALVTLPGIGPVLSARIIKYRNLLGGFVSVEQLKEVYGLKQETYDLISDRVTADSTAIGKININTAGFRELSKLPYFERYEITSVLKYRELQGRIKGMAELVENKILTSEKSAKILPYISFGE